jgi:hypothetical protein
MAAPTTPLRFKSGQQPYGRRRLNRLGQSLICFSQLALHRGWVRELTETRLAIVAVLLLSCCEVTAVMVSPLGL